MKITELAPAHVNVAAAMDGLCFDVPVFTQDMLSTILKSQNVFGLIAHEGEHPVGYAIFQQSLDEAEILTICILPDHQGKGFGRKLLNAGLAELKSRMMTDVFLEVRRSNQSAISMYESFGAKAVGERPKYYEDGEDAVVYKLELL